MKTHTVFINDVRVFFQCKTKPQDLLYFYTTHLLCACADLDGIGNQPRGFLSGDRDNIFESQRYLLRQIVWTKMNILIKNIP